MVPLQERPRDRCACHLGLRRTGQVHIVEYYYNAKNSFGLAHNGNETIQVDRVIVREADFHQIKGPDTVRKPDTQMLWWASSIRGPTLHFGSLTNQLCD